MRFAVPLVLIAFVAASAGVGSDSIPVGSFRPLATFNVPGGAGSAEIVSATPDGNTLVYSDAVQRRLGRVDLTNPGAPVQSASIDLAPLGLTPTSVAVLPNATHALVTAQPSRLLLVGLNPFQVVNSLTIGAGPDSVAVAEIGGSVVAAVAIENEGALPPGRVEVITLNLANFAASSRRVVCFIPGADCHVDASALYLTAGPLNAADPQPEYVSILGTRLAVTLQENNVIVVIDLGDPSAPTVQTIFSAGVVANRPADLAADDVIAFDDVYPADVAARPNAGARIPDAIAWSADGTTLFTADEGENDYEGGRGWSAHAPVGGVLYDDGGELEGTAVRRGHYLDDRIGDRQSSKRSGLDAPIRPTRSTTVGWRDGPRGGLRGSM